MVGDCASKLMCVRGGLGKSAEPQHSSFMGLQMKTQKIIPKTHGRPVWCIAWVPELQVPKLFYFL